MLIVRGEDFTCARTVSDKLAGEEKITVRFNTEIMEASGQGMVSKAVFRDTRTGEEWAFRADGEESSPGGDCGVGRSSGRHFTGKACIPSS